MKNVSVLIKSPDMQYEGLRTSLGLLLEDLVVQMIVLDYEISNMDDAYADNLGFFDEMGGRYYSNHPNNVNKYGFQPADVTAIGAILRETDLIIPF